MILRSPYPFQLPGRLGWNTGVHTSGRPRIFARAIEPNVAAEGRQPNTWTICGPALSTSRSSRTPPTTTACRPWCGIPRSSCRMSTVTPPTPSPEKTRLTGSVSVRVTVETAVLLICPPKGVHGATLVRGDPSPRSMTCPRTGEGRRAAPRSRPGAEGHRHPAGSHRKSEGDRRPRESRRHRCLEEDRSKWSSHTPEACEGHVLSALDEASPPGASPAVDPRDEQAERCEPRSGSSVRPAYRPMSERMSCSMSGRQSLKRAAYRPERRR